MATVPHSDHDHPSVQPSESITIPRDLYERILGRLQKIYSRWPSDDIRWAIAMLQNPNNDQIEIATPQ
jgi:hypothetical protein